MPSDHDAPRLVDRLSALARSDRLLLLTLSGAALIALAVGAAFGAATALVRAGFVEVHPESGYRLLTAHGATAFFFWLSLAQMTVLLALSATQSRAESAIAWRWAAWLGSAAMIAGYLVASAAILIAPPLLYDVSPELVGEARGSAFAFYLGYLLLGLGMSFGAVAAIAGPLGALRAGAVTEWSATAFATVAWAGLTIVSAYAMFDAFVPAALWTLGLGGVPSDHAGAWHLLFHNLHYLPLMATVLIWYVAIEALTGVSSIFGSRFSKQVFSLYLIFVPPTSLYHMFLEPGLAPSVRVLGSLLSLLVGVPTVLVFLIIVISLESAARANGARGLFAWLSRLPWRVPAMSAIGAAVSNLALGGVFAFVLIQERLAALLSDTFFVPAYFHFLTVGTVTLTLLAVLSIVIPALSGRFLWRPRVLTAMPVIVSIGLLGFGFAGTFAGLTGAPRRALQIDYDGAAPSSWQSAMGVVGVAALVMSAGLLVNVYGLLRAMFGRRSRVPGVMMPTCVVLRPTNGGVLAGAWTAPACVAVLLLGMYGATAIAFDIMRNLPVVVVGDGGH